MRFSIPAIPAIAAIAATREVARERRRILAVSFIALALLLSGLTPLVAHAQIDLTGEWTATFTTDPIFGGNVLTVCQQDLTQTEDQGLVNVTVLSLCDPGESSTATLTINGNTFVSSSTSSSLCTSFVSQGTVEDADNLQGQWTCDVRPEAGLTVPLLFGSFASVRGVDTCRGGVDTVDSDMDGIADFCDDCPNGADMSVCDDGNACTLTDTCQAGGCTGSGQLACDDGDACNGVETCDTIQGCLLGTPLTCDNGLFCDGAESCDAELGCQAGTAPTTDDGIACTDDSCDEVNDVIVNAVNDGNCDDGDTCNGVETCDTIQGCLPGTPLICDNDLFCDGAESCNAALGCQAGTAPTTDDGIACTDDSCDEVNDVIVNAVNDGSCDDNNVCTNDSCDVSLGCVNLIVDADGDSVPDCSDNCIASANGNQHDSDGDGVGDVCDPSTINASFNESIVAGTAPMLTSGANNFAVAAAVPGTKEYHISTPYQRVKLSSAGGVEIKYGAEAGGGIGMAGSDDSKVIALNAMEISGVQGGYALDDQLTITQSTWQGVVAENLEAVGLVPRFHAGSYANGIGFGVEVPIEEILGGENLAFSFDLQLPLGLCLDRSEVDNGGGVGRLTIRESASGTCDGTSEIIRLSAAEFVAFGARTVLQDTESPNEYYGLQRLTEELDAQQLTATVGPADTVGSNFYNPSGADQTVEAPLVQNQYTLEENQPDWALGRITVTLIAEGSFRVTLVAPSALIERNRATSGLVMLGLRISSLTAIDLGTGSTVHCRHAVSFDEEAEINGNDVTIVCENEVVVPPALPTFDGRPVDYTLLPNAGGTAAIENWAEQQQTGFGCSGCSMTLTGNSRIEFPNGGAGVAISGGSRVGPAHPCLADNPLDRATNTGRCEADMVKRGALSAESLTISGSMGGLAATESDIDLLELKFYQARDPNVTDEIALHAAGGVGCSADSGVRIGRNPADGEILSNVPLDLNGCTPDAVGEGTCRPTPLSTPPGTGICNFRVLTMELHGMNSDNNPLGTDLTVPTGCGVTLASRSGVGEIGAKSYNPITDRCEASSLIGDPPPSLIEGFQCMAAASGGANVDGDTGEGLTAEDPRAVPPNVYCLDGIRGDNHEIGLVVGGNVDVRASRLNIERTQFGAIYVASNMGSNVETVASTAAAGSECPTIDGVNCRTMAEELASPSSKQGDVNYLAVSGLGKSAPTKLSVTASVLGVDAAGNPSAGLNPALGDLVVDPDTLVAASSLTIAGRQASLGSTPVFVAKGADSIGRPELLSLSLKGNNIGMSSPAIAIDNRDSPGAPLDLIAEGNCYSPGNNDCIKVEGAALLATAQPDPEIVELNTVALEQAASVPNPAGADLAGAHKCYGVRAPGAPSVDQVVTLIDRFGTTSASVRKSIDFCGPVNESGNGLPDPEAHLNCYQIQETEIPLPTVIVRTQFGEDTFPLARGYSLCVPAINQAIGGQPRAHAALPELEERLNSFKCYLRDAKAPKEVAGILTLADEIDQEVSVVVKAKPLLVCAAATVGPGGVIVESAAQHLACYGIKDENGQRTVSPRSVEIEDQFLGAAGGILDLDKGRLLCEPANVAVVNPL